MLVVGSISRSNLSEIKFVAEVFSVNQRIKKIAEKSTNEKNKQ